MKERIEKILRENFDLEIMEVKNNSYLHAGHLGENQSEETHFAITIKSKNFKGVPRIAAHRKINKLLEDEFLKGLHALEIKVLPLRD